MAKRPASRRSTHNAGDEISGRRASSGGRRRDDGSRKAWAGRFGDATSAAAEAYTSSIGVDARLLGDDIEASIAHARMLGRQGIIPGADAAAIVRGLEEIADEFARGEFVFQEDLEDVHMNVEARLAEKVGDAAGRLHTARSRNDQVATDFRMYVKRTCGVAISRLLDLERALVGVAEANVDVVMPGYTHLQRAQPVLFAHHMLAYVQMFDRDVARFAFAYEMADELPLGSGALAGVPYPIDREAVAEDLEFARISQNSIDAVSDRDFVVDYLSAAALAMVHISRLAEEIVLWSGAEFGFVRLPDAFATGSSIMPQKKNPDVLELARGRCGHVVGDLVAMLTTLKGLPLAYNRDLQEDKPLLFGTEDTLLSTLEVLGELLPRIEVDAQRMGEAAEANFALATDLADYLVRKGLPFREAHQAVGALVRQCEERAVTFGDVTLEDMRAFSPLFGHDALEIDVMASLRSRDVPGGTAPRQVARALKAVRKRLAGLSENGARPALARRPRKNPR